MTPRSPLFCSFSRALTTACLTMAASIAFCAEAQVDLRPQWKTGEQVRYELTKTRTKKTVSATSRTDVRMEVVEATAKGFLLRTVLGSTRMDTPQAQAAQMTERISSPLQDLEILLEVDHDGTVLRIRNWQEVRTALLKVTGMLADLMRQQKTPQPVIDQAMARVEQMYATEAGIRNTVMREIHLIFVPLGRTYSTVEPFEYTTDLPVLIGSGTIPAKGMFELTSIEQAKALITIRWQQSADSSAMTSSVAKVLEESSKSTANRTVDLPHMTLSDDGEFVVNTISGWPDFLTYTRKVTSGTDEQSDTTTFKRQ